MLGRRHPGTSNLSRPRHRAAVGVALAVATALAVVVPTAGANAAGLPSRDLVAPPLPTSIAATGDSITLAFDVDWSHLLHDAPAYSWSTGTSTAVDSQYQHLLALEPEIAGQTHVDAANGATMADLPGQLQQAAGQQAQYVTVLMGANDLCTSSAATMTSTAEFRSQFTTALAAFHAADPNAVVFVSSIPNLQRLWTVLHGNWLAELTWNVFGICPSMLSWSNSSTDRAKVGQREQAFNQILGQVCGPLVWCRWDGDATYDIAFTAADISTVDYFHPSARGQRKLAAATWAASFWAGATVPAQVPAPAVAGRR